MKRPNYFYFMAILLMFVMIPSIFSQEYKNEEELAEDVLWGQTDVVFMDGKEYLINKALLADFEGYKDLYPEILKEEYTVMPEGGLSRDFDTPYCPYFLIDDSLIYLVGIKLNSDIIRVSSEMGTTCDYYLPIERFMRMEKLVNKRFEKGLIPEDLYMAEIMPNYSIGTMFASWVNGIYYIKQVNDGSLETGTWIYRPALRLTIKNGKVMHIEKV